MPQNPKRRNSWTPCESWSGIYFTFYEDLNKARRQTPSHIVTKFSYLTHPNDHRNQPALNKPETPRYVNSQRITPTPEQAPMQRTNMGLSPKHPSKPPQLKSQTISEAPKFTQAFRILRKFGGPYRLSAVMKEIDIHCQAQTMYCWLRPDDDPRGTGGLIPAPRVRDILEAARADGVLLTSHDWDPRPLPLDELESYFMFEVSEVYDKRYGRWRKIDLQGVERALEKDIKLGEEMHRILNRYQMRRRRKEEKK